MWKKIRGYVLAFVGGIVSLLLFNRVRNGSARENIDKLRAKLNENEGLISKLELTNNKLAEQFRQSRSTVSRLEDKLRQAGSNVDEIERINVDIAKESDSLDETIDELRAFIQDNK